MTSPDGLNVIISVAVDDQTGVLNEVPARVRLMVQQTNEALAQLAAENPLLALEAGAERGAASLTELQVALVRVGEVLATAREEIAAFRAAEDQPLRFNFGPAFAQLAELQHEMDAIIVRRGELALGGVAGRVAGREAELERAIAAAPRPVTPYAALAPYLQPGAGIGGLANVPQLDENALRAEVTRLRAEAASTEQRIRESRLAGGPAVSEDERTAATLKAGQATELERQGNALKAERNQLEQAYIAEQDRSLAIQRLQIREQEILASQPTAQLRQLALRQAEAVRTREQLAGSEDANARSRALRAELSTTEALIVGQAKAAAAQQEVQAAAAGGGGFFGGFRAGVFGGHGEDRGGATAENIGQQIGQVAKYIYLYEAFIKVSEGIKESIKLTKEYENGLVALQVALASVGQQGAVTASQIATVGAQAGFSPGESLQAAARGIQAFRDDSSVSAAAAQRVALESVDAAQQGVVLSGQKMAESQDKIIASTRAYELGAAGQTRVLDAVTNANINFGASIKDVLDGVAQVADVGKESGFSIEQLANAIGLISSTTGLTGEQSAGDLKRILGGAGAPAFQNALVQVGVSTNQSTEQELEQLGERYKSLTEAQQASVVATLGGRRAAEALIPLLESVGNFQDANARSIANSGAAADRYNKLQDTLAGVLRQVHGAFASLLTDLGQSGVGAGFGLALEAVVPLVKVLDDLIKGFDILPSGIREAAFALLEFAAVARLLQGINIGGFATNLLGRVRARGVSSGLIEGEEAAGTGVLARAGSRLAAGAVGTGLVAEGGVTAGLLALGPAAAAAAGALSALVLTQKSFSLAAAESKAGGLIGDFSGSSDELKNRAAEANAKATEIQAKSSGIFGSIADLLTGLGSGDKIHALHEYSKEVSTTATAIDQASQSIDRLDAFSPQNIGSVQKLNDTVKNLGEQGYSAAQILAQLGAGIDAFTGSLGGDLSKIPKGSLTTSLNIPGFVQGLFTDLIPKSVTDTTATQRSTAAAAAAAAAGRGVPPSLVVGRVEQLGLNATNAKAIRDQITALLSPAGGSPVRIVTPEMQAKIADIIVANYGLAKDDKTDRDLLRASILAKFQGLAGAGDQGSLLKADPALLQVFTAQAQAELQAATAEVTARGGSSVEIQKLQQTTLRKLLQLSSTALAVNIPSGAALQAAAAVSESIRNTFDQRVDALAAAAKATGGKQAAAGIDALVIKLKTEAGQVAADELPTSIRSLTQAEVLLTSLLGKGATAVGLASLTAITAEKEMVAGLKTQLTKLNSDVTAAAAGLDAADTGASEMRLIRAARAQGAGSLAVDAAQTKLDKDLQTLLNSLTLTPTALKELTTGLTAGSGASTVTDTAAQIAAAAAAASVFPGAKLEEARVQMQIAAANLAAEKPKTVAYFNALKALHQAQYDYTQALLDAQHVSRELGIDLTDPVAVAKENLKAAQAKLAADRHAPTDKQNEDKLAVQQAQTALEAAKFQERLDAARTAHDLGQISTQKYLQILDAQRDNLLRIVKRTHQQQQELNEVNQLIQDVQKSLQTGQFNLGEIKLPTPYEVRRQVLGGSGAAVGNVQNINVNVNGGDLTAVVGVLSHFLGPAAFSNTAVSPQKI